MKILALIEHLLEEKIGPLAMVVAGAVDAGSGGKLGHPLDMTLVITGLTALGFHVAALNASATSASTSA